MHIFYGLEVVYLILRAHVVSVIWIWNVICKCKFVIWIWNVTICVTLGCLYWDIILKPYADREKMKYYLKIIDFQDRRNSMMRYCFFLCVTQDPYNTSSYNMGKLTYLALVWNWQWYDPLAARHFAGNAIKIYCSQLRLTIFNRFYSW